MTLLRDERNKMGGNIIVGLLMEHGSQRFSQIWNEVKGKPLFKSKRDLRDALYYLEHQPQSLLEARQQQPYVAKKQAIIKKQTVTRRHVIYTLTIDENEMELIKSGFASLQREFPKVLQELREAKSHISLSQVPPFYEAATYMLLQGYLNVLESWVRLRSSLQDFFYENVVKEYIIQDALMLGEMGRAFPDGMDECLRNVRTTLCSSQKQVMVNSKLWIEEAEKR